MTLYIDGGNVLDDSVKQDVLTEIETLMDNGEFNTGVHPLIANVTFLETVATGIEAGSQGDTASNSPQRRLRFPFYAVAAVGGLMIIAAGVIWRRKRNSVDEGSALTGDTSTLQDGGVPENQAATGHGEAKPPGDSTEINTTLDFSSIQE